MDRKRRTPSELQNASNHIHYELRMLTTAADCMALGLFGDGAINSLLLESFVIHARSLLAFFYPAEQPRDDDVVIGDFFPELGVWLAARPEKSNVLTQVNTRANKEIAHLTYTRQELTDETKYWMFLDIATEIAALGISLQPACHESSWVKTGISNSRNRACQISRRSYQKATRRKISTPPTDRRALCVHPVCSNLNRCLQEPPHATHNPRPARRGPQVCF
jgi:hypothetical protein